ncbi:LutC/YkgG family protein [Rubrobacter calidifluminis]|uniref:LutC/YkgG family protein n=1 Tax=Rubrobacter calidifluminis TaxID=1392640 RepID=UPI002361E8BC|nr:lactate utilization protein [Rubrobacter calidifluminis]
MARREEFLEGIRHRTRAGRYHPTRAPDVAWTPRADGGRKEGHEDPAERFVREFEAVGGHAVRASGIEEARDYVLEVLRGRGARRVVRWDGKFLEGLGLEEAGLEVAVYRGGAERRSLEEADAGVTEARWALAETGSLLLESGGGRLATLLPPVHVVLVPEERLLGTLEEALGEYEGGRMPPDLCFHTGPSRSGDIEMTLTVGVHGPGEVHAVLVRQPGS